MPAGDVMYELRELVLEVHDPIIGLQLTDIAVDGCIAKAPCCGEKAGKSLVDQRKRRTKTLTVVDMDGASSSGLYWLRPLLFPAPCVLVFVYNRSAWARQTVV